MNGWTTAWLFWLAMFLVIEIPALLNKNPGDTLSEHVWNWFSILNKSEGWLWRRVVLAAFLLWMVWHLLTGKRIL